MSPSERVRAALAESFKGFERTEVRLERGTNPGDEFVDVYRYPGTHDGKEWELLAPIQVQDGRIGTISMGIWSAHPGESFEHVCTLADAGRHGIPAQVVEAADEVMRRIESSEIQSLVVSQDARPLLKLLKEIVVAQSSGDEDALGSAMEAARETVEAFYQEIDLNEGSSTPSP